MGDKNQFVDELLDSALGHHRAAEPRPGIEGRILERVRATASEEVAAGKAWKLWIATAAAAAVVMFVAIRVANRWQSPAQTSQAAIAAPSTSRKEIATAKSGATPKAGAATAVVEPKRLANHKGNQPRQVEAHHWPSQFPTPAPLTAQQEALVQYVRETPPQVLAASLFKGEPGNKPMEIKPLKIAPMEIPPLAIGATREQVQ